MIASEVKLKRIRKEIQGLINFLSKEIKKADTSEGKKLAVMVIIKSHLQLVLDETNVK